MSPRETAESILYQLALDPMVTHEKRDGHDLPPDGGWHTRYEIVNTVTRSIESVDLGAVPLILHCPKCNARHIDRGKFATKRHHTHACQACGLCWRPAVVDTVGVEFLPGFKDDVGEAASRAGNPGGK